MDVGAIDRSATLGAGPLRAADPRSKLVALALVIGAVLVSWNVLVLASVLIGLAAACAWGRLPFGLAMKLAGYPAIFALVFAYASAPDLMTASVIVLKAVAAALGAVTVVLSTPYPQVFAPIQRITPGIVGDAMLMTYRSLFILLEKFTNLLRAARVRAGLAGRDPVRSARIAASALGGLLLYAVDLAQRDYDIMRVRGYEGRLRATPERSSNRWADIVIITSASLMLMTSVMWRAASSELNPFTWVVPLPALTALLFASLRRRGR